MREGGCYYTVVVEDVELRKIVATATLVTEVCACACMVLWGRSHYTWARSEFSIGARAAADWHDRHEQSVHAKPKLHADHILCDSLQVHPRHTHAHQSLLISVQVHPRRELVRAYRGCSGGCVATRQATWRQAHARAAGRCTQAHTGTHSGVPHPFSDSFVLHPSISIFPPLSPHRLVCGSSRGFHSVCVRECVYVRACVCAWAHMRG